MKNAFYMVLDIDRFRSQVMLLNRRLVASGLQPLDYIHLN